MTPLSEHFTKEELCFSSTAVRLRIANEPTLEVLAHLKETAEQMENVREILKAPIVVDSGFRCVTLNTAVGGAVNSAHIYGWAVDFICPKFGNPLSIVKELASSNLVFDQCIQEGSWVHISFDPKMRRRILTAHFGPTGTTYTTGV